MDLKLDFDRTDYSNKQRDVMSESASVTYPNAYFFNRLRNCLQIDS